MLFRLSLGFVCPAGLGKGLSIGPEGLELPAEPDARNKKEEGGGVVFKITFYICRVCFVF